jgi:hypothetical protein
VVDPCPLIAQPWWQWHPPVGTFIGVLGVLGVIVPWLFRPPEKMGKGEKALWTLLVFVLFGLELRTLYLDRDEHDRAEAQARCEQLHSFNEIAGGIRDAVAQSQKQFNATMGGISREINIYTGGESYAYLTYVPKQQSLVFVHKGDYPLFSVGARITDLDDPNNLIGTVVQVGDVIRGHAVFTPVPNSISATQLTRETVNFNVFFTARNGDWTELFRARRIHDGWATAIIVEGSFSSMKKSSIVCETIDKRFPEGALDKEFREFRKTSTKPPPCK